MAADGSGGGKVEAPGSGGERDAGLREQRRWRFDGRWRWTRLGGGVGGRSRRRRRRPGRRQRRGSGGEAGVFVGEGTITYERWNGVPGESVSLVPVTRAPDVTMQLSLFQAPNDVGQDFGARLRGFLTAPVTGSYTFFISCDDNGALDLSTDDSPANKKRIAHVTGSPAWTDYVEWTKFPTQKSQPIALVAGSRYYVEALLKEDVAEDHLAVGWLKPGEVGLVPSGIIPGRQLDPIRWASRPWLRRLRGPLRWQPSRPPSSCPFSARLRPEELRRRSSCRRRTR